MTKIDIFGDGRKTPKISINVKIKVKTNSLEESICWNKVFGYIMKKPRTKLEFLNVNFIRSLQLNKLTLDKLQPYLAEEDYTELNKIQDLFDNRLSLDVKAFVLAILRVPVTAIEKLITA